MAQFSTEDVAEINLRRRPHNRFGSAYQMAFVRLYTRFPTQQPLEIGDEVVTIVGLQVALTTEAIETYQQRRETVEEHQQRLREYLGLRRFGEVEIAALEKFLFDEACHLDRPEISLVSRDRSPEYRAAITDTLPQAIQVVDRWHLVKILREALERSIEGVYPKSEAQGSAIRSRGSERALRTRFPRSGADEQLREGRREQRIQRYQIVQELKSHGMSIRHISTLLGLARGTVRNFYFADTYPETQRQKTRPSILDPYLPYL